MYKVLVSEGCHKRGLDLLSTRQDVQVVVMNAGSEESLASCVREAKAILVRTTRLSAATLSAATELQIVSRHGVGYDNVDVEYLSSRNIPMALAVDSNVTSVAEHTLMFMLALSKDCLAADARQRAGDYAYRDKRTATDLGGKNVLVMGYGRIGRHVSMLCRVLGMTVHVYDPFVSQEALAEGEHLEHEYRTALPRMDVVTLHMPLTPENTKCIGKNELALMKPTAFLINCARGGLIDEQALYRALADKQLAGAALDVFAEEPPHMDNPLFTLPNIIVSPHNAALTDECAGRMSYQAAQNILDCFEGKLSPRTVINRRELGL